jgi:hypothetical protein
VGQVDKGAPIYELKRLTGRELNCIRREPARGDEDATIGALSRDHPKQLSDAPDWNSSI